MENYKISSDRFRGSRRSRHLGRAALWFGACSLLLAACSSSSSSSKATTAVSKSSTPVTIAKAVNTIGFTPENVAVAKGYFAKQNISVSSVLLSGSSTSLAALEANSVQFVMASATSVLLARAHNVPIQSVLALNGLDEEVLVSRAWAESAHLSTNDSLATIVRGLATATLGTISVTDKALWELFFKDEHVSMTGVKFVTISSSAALTALQHGLIDAFFISPPDANAAAANGSGVILARADDLPQTKGMADGSIVVDTNYAKSHPGIVQAVVTAIARAENLIRSNPKSVLSIEKQVFPDDSSAVLRQSLALESFPKDGLQTEAMWNKAVSVNSYEGLLSSNVSVKAGTAWTNRYVDEKAVN